MSQPEPAGFVAQIPRRLTMAPPFVTAQTSFLPTLTCLNPVELGAAPRNDYNLIKPLNG